MLNKVTDCIFCMGRSLAHTFVKIFKSLYFVYPDITKKLFFNTKVQWRWGSEKGEQGHKPS